MKKKKFYEFSQNNSGGSFVVDSKLCHRLFIEADTLYEAKTKMESLGAYFDGDGDCPCCGPRWSDFEDETIFPFRYGTFEKEKARVIAKKYKIDYKKTTWRFMGTEEPEDGKYDLIFPTPLVYANFLKDEYGSTTPDSRIYYKTGRVKEV